MVNQTNSTNPLVSICIPVYNGEKMIHRALEGCLNQTYRNLEIIVVDNASTDNTKEIVSRYLPRDKRIKYFRNDTNIGLIKNYLRSFELAQGEFFQLLPCDDWLSKNYIEEGIKGFSLNNNIGAVFSRVIALLIQSGDSFAFANEVILKSRIYSTDYFFRITYRSQVGANDILAMLRTKDVKDTTSDILFLLKYQQYSKLYEIGFAIDRLIVPKVLSKYPFFFYTDKSAYVKIGHTQNVGKQFKSGLMGMNQMELNDAFRTIFEYLYRGELSKYLLGFRVNLGISMVNEAVIDFIKNKFSRQRTKELNKENIKLLLRDYTVLEKVLVAAGLVPNFTLRVIKFILRKFLERNRKIPYPLEEIFLDSKNHFKI